MLVPCRCFLRHTTHNAPAAGVAAGRPQPSRAGFAAGRPRQVSIRGRLWECPPAADDTAHSLKGVKPSMGLANLLRLAPSSRFLPASAAPLPTPQADGGAASAALHSR